MAIPEMVASMVRRHSLATSLLVPGFVDLNAVVQIATPFPWVSFLGNSDGCLEISVDSASGHLCLNETSAPRIPDALLDTPDIQPLLIDLSAYHLPEILPVRIVSVSFLLDPSRDSAHSYRAIAFNQNGDESLVFDPMWPFGIKIGDRFDWVQLENEIGLESVATLLLD